MAPPFQIALAAGLAIATVHAVFAWREGRGWAGTLRTFLGWLLAFAVAGWLAQPVATWLLTHVF